MRFSPRTVESRIHVALLFLKGSNYLVYTWLECFSQDPDPAWSRQYSDSDYLSPAPRVKITDADGMIAALVQWGDLSESAGQEALLRWTLYCAEGGDKEG